MSKLRLSSLIAGFCAFFSAAQADISPFETGWSLDPEASTLNFVSIKEGQVMELSALTDMAGLIAEDGEAVIEIPLDGVKTGIDLRNVRMRFLLFETFLYPEATVEVDLTAAMLTGLQDEVAKKVMLPFTLKVHGVERDMMTEVLVTLANPNRVKVSSIAPIIMNVDDFGLLEGIEKLQETAGVTIVPATAITFNFTFLRNKTLSDPVDDAALADALEAVTSTETLSHSACAGRFEILSRTGNIYFEPNSDVLTANSFPLLAAVAEIIERCKDMVVEVGGHTDNVGNDAYNQALSMKRSRAVVDHLILHGLDSNHFIARGFGESRPIATNETEDGRHNNRRITFKLESFAYVGSQ